MIISLLNDHILFLPVLRVWLEAIWCRCWFRVASGAVLDTLASCCWKKICSQSKRSSNREFQNYMQQVQWSSTINAGNSLQVFFFKYWCCCMSGDACIVRRCAFEFVLWLQLLFAMDRTKLFRWQYILWTWPKRYGTGDPNPISALSVGLVHWSCWWMNALIGYRSFYECSHQYFCWCEVLSIGVCILSNDHILCSSWRYRFCVQGWRRSGFLRCWFQVASGTVLDTLASCCGTNALIFNHNDETLLRRERRQVMMPIRVIVQDGSSVESAIVIPGLLQVHRALVLIPRTWFFVPDTFR